VKKFKRRFNKESHGHNRTTTKQHSFESMSNGLRDYFKGWDERRIAEHNARVARGKGLPVDAGSLAPSAEPKRSPAAEQVAAPTREAVVQERRLVRVTSFRARTTDDDNIYHKDLLDALTESGAIVDDSKAWIELERHQVKVGHVWQERTEVEVMSL
jgi:hypothetical protein